MEFGILGPLVVEAQGRRLSIRQEKLRALLVALLVRRNRVASADALIEDLWAEQPPKTARATLQVYVAQLRKLLEADPSRPARLLTRESGYLLRVADEELDVDRFERLVEEGREALVREADAIAATRLRKALQLWRGVALADLDTARVTQERHRLEVIRMAVEEDWIDAELRMGHHVTVVDPLTRLVQEQPFREHRWSQLMLALYRSERQAEALRTYQEARRVLGEELGIEPGPGLRQLENAILLQDPSLDLPEAGITPEAPSPRHLPLLGRRTELLVLEDAMRLADQGVPVVVSVSGPPGAGKSRLLEELMARPGDRTVRAARAYRTDAERPSGLMDDLDVGSVDLASAVVVVDDAHWADPSSLATLRRHVLRAEHGVFMVLAHRPVAGIPGSSLRRLWDAAGAVGEFVPVELGPLRATDLLPIVGGAASEALANRLVAASGGLPFQLQEMVARLTDTGVLEWSGERLIPAEPGNEVLAETAADFLADLSTRQMRLMECVAVANRPVPADAAAAVVGVDRAEVLDLGDALTRRGLLRGSPEGFLPVHDLIADRVEAEMGEVRKAETRRALADALVAMGVDQTEPAWVGGLYLAAARWRDAFPHLAEAALEAADRKAYLEALPVADGALEAYRRARLDDPRLEGRLRHARAWGARLIGRWASVEEDADFAVRVLDAPFLLDALVLAAQVAEDRHDLQKAEWLYAVAERESMRSNDLGTLGYLLGERAHALDLIGFPAEAEELYLKGERLTAAYGDAFQRLNVAVNQGMSASYRGEERRSEQAFRSAMEWSRRAGDGFLPLVESWLARALLLTGRITEGREAYRRALTAAERELFPLAIANASSSLSVGLESIGRYEEALRAAEDSLSTVLQYVPGTEGAVRVQRAKALIGLGEHEEAEEELRNARRALAGATGVNLWRVRCRVAELAVIVARGSDWPLAEATSLSHELEHDRRWGALVDLLILRARAERDPSMAERAAEMALELGTPMQAAAAAHAGDLWPSHLGGRVAAALRDMEAHLPVEWFDDWAALPQAAAATLASTRRHERREVEKLAGVEHQHSGR